MYAPSVLWTHSTKSRSQNPFETIFDHRSLFKNTFDVLFVLTKIIIGFWKISDVFDAKT